MNGEPINILLVEDDLAHAEIVKRNFENFNVANKLHHAADGQEAIDFLFKEGKYLDKDMPTPDLILLDLRLPKVEGLEVLSMIKKDDKLRKIAVVVLTTSRAEADVLSAYDHGVNSYLVKPVDFDKFVELMNGMGYYWLLWNRYPY